MIRARQSQGMTCACAAATAALMCVIACDKPAEQVRSTQAPQAPALRTFALEAPPAALPSPATLRFVRMRDQRAGTIQLGASELPLFGVGLGRCEDGWAVQGYYIDAQGKPAVTQAISLGVAPVANQPMMVTLPELPWSGPREAVAPPPERVATAIIQHISFERVVGDITLAIDGQLAWRMRLDAKPVGLAPSYELLGRACHMTGYATIESAGFMTASLAAFGASANASLHTAYIPLSADEALVVMIGHKLTQQHTPLDVRIPNIKLSESAGRPVRVYLARRDASAEGGWAPTSLEAGALALTWPANKPNGPVELTITGMQLPAAWRGRLSEASGPLHVRALVMFPNDAKGLLVPVPPPPAWWAGALQR